MRGSRTVLRPQIWRNLEIQKLMLRLAHHLASTVTTAVVAHVQLYARFRVLALELSRILSPLLAVSLVTT